MSVSSVRNLVALEQMAAELDETRALGKGRSVHVGGQRHDPVPFRWRYPEIANGAEAPRPNRSNEERGIPNFPCWEAP